MNGNTAKYAKWYARIIDPKVIRYTFVARDKPVDAQKFECILVSKDARQYMLGSVPFEFKTPKAAESAYEKFKEGTVWEITTPAFAKAKLEYNGCPIKNVLLMTQPTKMKSVFATNKAEHDHPAQGLCVHLEITGIMDVLGKRDFPEGPGSARVPTKTFDFMGKLMSLSEQKILEKAGRVNKVATAEFVDKHGGKIVVSVWNEAYQLLRPLALGVVHIIDDTVPAQQQTFKVVSEHVTCLLSESPNAVQLQLVAYCDFDKSLAYRLDKERALVLVSAVEFHEPGTRITATVENMEKISKDEWKALQRAMTLEWRSVLTTIGTNLSTPKRVSSSDQEYWTQSASKLRRLESEPVTPK